MTRLAALAVVLAAVAAVVALNVLLLGRASSGNDPVGKLSPAVSLPGQTPSPAPAGVVQPSTGRVGGEGRDD